MHGGCWSSEVYFSQSVLQKGGTVVYIVQYNNIGKYKQVYMYANSINTGPIRDGIIRVGKGHHTSPKFFGWQEGHKKNLKTGRAGMDTARTMHGMDSART